MKKIILFSLLFFSKTVYACECPALQPISKELRTDYDVIFFGKVDSVSSCTNAGIATVYFTIQELYKGAVEEHVKVDFDCRSSCLMSFAKNEEWLMYTNYQHFDVMIVNICKHSRKHFDSSTQDIYQIAAQRTFEQEKEFLKSTLGIQAFIKKNELNKQHAELAPRNEQPSGQNKLILILISFSVMAIVYVLTRNKRRK
jgi:hypothetical protein